MTVYIRRERWLPVVGYEGCYEVSSHGRVWSVPRLRLTNNGKSAHVCGRYLKQNPNHNGYLQVALYRDGVRRTHRVHQVMAAAFIGPCPPGQQVRHLNDHKLDNYVWNLAYGTGEDNCADRERNGKTARLHGEDRATSKLTEPQVREIYRRFADGDDTALIATDFGISRSVVTAIGNGNAWKHLNLPPVYHGLQWHRRQRDAKGHFT